MAAGQLELWKGCVLLYAASGSICWRRVIKQGLQIEMTTKAGRINSTWAVGQQLGVADYPFGKV